MTPSSDDADEQAPVPVRVVLLADPVLGHPEQEIVARLWRRRQQHLADRQSLRGRRPPVSRIVELTTDRFHREENGAYLILDRHPVLLPPKLALLIEEQVAQPVTDSPMRQQFGNEDGYLFPGKAPGRPRNVLGTHNLLNQFGLPVLSARNTAMIEAVTSLPPIVVADLFGMHPSTAQRWANSAKDDWSTYLAARMAADVRGCAPKAR
ncbi:hypothetical protein ACFQ10_54865 [Streptomyces indonesiensis]